MHIDYKETLLTIPRFVLSTVLLIALLALFKNILPISSTSRLVQLANILLSGLVGGGIYLLINFKSIKTILPPKLLKKLGIN